MKLPFVRSHLRKVRLLWSPLRDSVLPARCPVPYHSKADLRIREATYASAVCGVGTARGPIIIAACLATCSLSLIWADQRPGIERAS